MEFQNDYTFAACLNCHKINKILHQDVPQAVCSQCQSPIKFKKLISECDEAAFKELVQTSDLEVIAYFFTSSCMACKIFSSHFEKASLENLNMVFVKINLQGNETFAAFMEVKAYPCVILFKDGFEEKRHYGIMNDSSLKDFLMTSEKSL